MSKMQYRFVNENAPEITGGSIRGRAVVYNKLSADLGGFRERVRPGALDRSLREIQDGSRVVDARIQHQGGLHVCGSTANDTLRLIPHAEGVDYEITPPDTQAGRDLKTLVKDGYLRHSSFAFECADSGMTWDWNERPPIVELHDVDLVDVAPCSRPAYDETTVEMRSLLAPKMRQAKPMTGRTRAEVKAEGDRKHVEFYLLDQILPDWMRRYDENLVTSGSIINTLRDTPDAERIDVFINSPGGDVFEGLSIFNTLKEHPAPVHVHIRGLAASIAGIIAMAGDHIQMGQGTFIMVHNAWTIALGNAQEFRTEAARLDKVDASLAGILATRSGRDLKQVQKWMRDETWFTAEESITNGLADRIGSAASEATAGLEGERCRNLGFQNIPLALGGPEQVKARVLPVELAELRTINERALRTRFDKAL